MKKNVFHTGILLFKSIYSSKTGKIMRISFFLFLIGALNMFAVSSYSQKTRLSLKTQSTAVKDVLKQIENASEFYFLYNNKLIDVERKVNLNIKNERIDDILKELFNGTDVDFVIIDKQIVLTPGRINNIDAPNISRQKQLSVKGKVTDTNGDPIPGVNVFIKGTTTGTITSADGTYSLTVPDESTLVFSFIGMKTVEIPVNGNTTINVTMESAVIGLDEVVTIGYGTQKKKLSTGANLNVKGDVITKLTPSNSMEALQGISPGVSITRSNGQPGSTTKVYIRGMGTIGNASPLYIVDGVTVGNIDYLSPSDIESIDVLKDAASAAIYGARAANGVILVTTKKGKKGKLSVNFDSYLGWQNVYKDPDMLNAQQYAMIQSEGRSNDGLPDWDYNTLVPDWDKIQSGQWKGTNWFDEIKNENALLQNYSLGFTGGSDQSVYSFGASYLDDQGILGKQSDSRYQRLNIRLNSEHKLWTKDGIDIIKFGENIVYTNKKNPGIRTGNIYWSDIRNMLGTSPFLPLYDENGDYHYAIDWNPGQANPIALMEYTTKYNDNIGNSFVGDAYIEFQPIKNLIIRSQYGFNAWFNTYRHWVPSYNLSNQSYNQFDDIDQSMSQGYNYTFTNTVNYSFNINDEHDFTLLAGTEMNKTTMLLNVSGHNENGIFEDWKHAYLNNYPVVDPAYTRVNGAEWGGDAILSYFGRFSYNYKEKYLLTFVLRADGSSNFTEGNRWGVFPSLSGGWVLTNESFLEDQAWLSYLKIRASWGQNGNKDIGAFQYASTMSYHNGYYNYGGDKTIMFLGAYPARKPNPDVTWETSEQTDIGLDAHFLNSRLQFTFDWYKKDTKDWLVNPPVLATTGTASAYINGGSITNKGVEFYLGWKDNLGPSFKYGISATLAYNHNEVTEIENDEKIIHGPANVLTHGMSEIYRAQEGYPIGYFWGFETDGVIQNQAEADAYNSKITSDPRPDPVVPGDIRFKDQNGDNIIDDNDKVMLGNPHPKYNYGLQIFMEYKGFYLNMTGTGQAGMQIAKSYRFWNSNWDNYTTDILKRWHGEGTSDKYPRVTAGANQNMLQMSDLFIEDGDYFRISNLTIGYDLNKLRSWPLKETKLYVSAKNLVTFTSYSGMDPEVGYAPNSWSSGVDIGLYPLARTFLVGLSIKF
ncbi:MAG: TonB-dependent receptor [Chlorobi bacterium]|nr:TonB-dependent receptor [Chlorobiota bacterium]